MRAPDGFPPSLQPLLARIADRRAARSEAALQADIRQLLLAADVGLHALYYCAIESRAEGNYLSAILNSPALTALVRPLMSYSKDERHIDKHLWKLPIPRYDDADPTHQRLAELGQDQCLFVAGLDLEEGRHFVTLRRRVRAELAAHPARAEIEAIVIEMLG
ncbi:hypothetical protein [Micromonospora sp. NPDC050495]|uniref:hypothetical protein n=1 Tax=Micromonospora sp. NPDC050495 TaxID=3154936 RepID=UPI0033F724A7